MNHFKRITLPKPFAGDLLAEFTAACQEARLLNTTITVSGLIYVLLVAQHLKPMSYADLGASTGDAYNKLAIRAGALSEGRGNVRGAGLLMRIQRNGEKQVLLQLTPSGWELASIFGAPRSKEFTFAIHALQRINEVAPGLSLGTLTAFMLVAKHEHQMVEQGEPCRIISVMSGLHNLSRHLAVLAEGEGRRTGMALISAERGTYSGRKLAPRLTGKGIALIEAVASILSGSIPEKEPAR